MLLRKRIDTPTHIVYYVRALPIVYAVLHCARITLYTILPMFYSKTKEHHNFATLLHDQ